jgi:hypothetical protein
MVSVLAAFSILSQFTRSLLAQIIALPKSQPRYSINASTNLISTSPTIQIPGNNKPSLIPSVLICTKQGAQTEANPKDYK